MPKITVFVRKQNNTVGKVHFNIQQQPSTSKKAENEITPQSERKPTQILKENSSLNDSLNLIEQKTATKFHKKEHSEIFTSTPLKKLLEAKQEKKEK